jgi:hypothetical protein
MQWPCCQCGDCPSGASWVGGGGGGGGRSQRVVWAAKETTIDIFLDYFTFSSLVQSVAGLRGETRSVKGSRRGCLWMDGRLDGWIDRTTAGELPREGKSLQRHYQRCVAGMSECPLLSTIYAGISVSLSRPHIESFPGAIGLPHLQRARHFATARRSLNTSTPCFSDTAPIM